MAPSNGKGHLLQFEKGAATKRSVDQYRVLRLDEMPEVTVKIVDSGESLGGIGEPGVPPIAPALVNAVFQATGVRHRSLPLFVS